MNLDAVLDQPHLSIIASTPDVELAAIRATVTRHLPVSGRAELEELFGRLLDVAPRQRVTPKTLDLIGHARAGTSLLALGSWTIDIESTIVRSFFRELAEHDVLPRLGIHALRLIGSLTADTQEGQHTICELSEVLGMEVYGAKNLVYAAHFGAAGFLEDHGMVLSRSSDLRRTPPTSQPLLTGTRSQRVLDLDALQAVSLDALGNAPWPRRFATRDVGGELLKVVRRNDGRTMPGLLTAPTCEVVLPSVAPQTFHVAQVLLDGALMRVYPEGPTAPGVCYSVAQPRELVQLVEALPQAASH